MSGVTLSRITKSYGALQVVHGIDLDVAEKEFVVLVGPSGCGKSTTLRMIAGLEEITSGDLTIYEKRMNRVAPKDRDVAMVFQNYALYPHLNVADNMAFGLRIRKMPKDEIKTTIADVAEVLGLTPYLDRRPADLSGGQRQRVAMGRAIVRHPKVFLFDEPLSNLDAKLRTQMRAEIKRLHNRLGVTSVYVTHDQVEAMTLADRIVVMNDEPRWVTDMVDENTSAPGTSPRGDAAQDQIVDSRFTRLYDHFRQEWQIYAMLLPTIIWFLVFLYKPMYGLQIAFKDYSIFRGVAGSPWIGFEHFQTLFTNDQFLRAVRNTIYISALNLLFGFPAPIILALMFNEVLHASYKRTAQTIVYLPHFISSVIIAGIVITAFSPTAGIVNTFIGWLGFDPVYFLTRPEWFRPIFVGTGIWQEAGFGSIVFLAAIAGVNPSLYESAVVDGANRWQMMWKITIPSILPTILIMLIIRIGNVMEVSFELVILLYQPSTYETADVVNTWIYRQGLQSGQYDLAAAGGLFNALVAFVLVMTANTLSRRYSRTSLW